jgi:hypothetical protein
MKKNIILLTVTILVCLLLGELCLQIYYRVNQGKWVWEKDAYTVTYTIPTSDERQYTLRPNFIDAQQGISVNAKGFRGEDLVQNNGEPKIIADLGDSVPFGAGVKDTDTYSYYLQEVLQSNSISGYAVLNAGVSSYNMRQSFIRLEIDVMKYYQPSIVTFTALNDFSLLTNYGKEWTPDVTWATIRKWIPPKTHYFAIEYYISKIFQGKQLESHSSADPTAMLEYTKNTLVPDIVSFCKSKGIKVVFIALNPFYYSNDLAKNEQLKNWENYKLYIDLWSSIISKYNDILKQASIDNPDVYYWDDCTYIDGFNREEMYLDFAHYSPVGNKTIAEGLFEFLKVNGLLEK